MNRAAQLLLMVLACASVHARAQAPAADEPVAISLAHGSAAEQQTEQRLRALMASHDLAPWTITHRVVIDETDIPHSHPVLTLHARHRHDDELLLSTYVHEQLHWFLAAHPHETALAEAALRERFPKMPVGYPEGSSDEDGNYEHLLVIWLEYRADQALLGELKAREVMQFWTHDHYTWLYEKVLADPDAVGELVARYHLNPLRPAGR